MIEPCTLQVSRLEIKVEIAREVRERKPGCIARLSKLNDELNKIRLEELIAKAQPHA